MIENETKNENVSPASNPEQDQERKKRTEESSSSRSPRKPFRGNPRRSDKRKFFMKKKVCFFCKNADVAIDYKDVSLMRRFVAESGKITQEDSLEPAQNIKENYLLKSRKPGRWH